MSDQDWTQADNVVEEVWEARRKVWKRCDDDPEKYMAYMRELHEQLVREGWTEAPPREPRKGKSAA